MLKSTAKSTLWRSSRARSVYLASIVHILSPETDNCPSWISERGRSKYFMITKECWRPGWSPTRNLLIFSRTRITLSHRSRPNQQSIRLRTSVEKNTEGYTSQRRVTCNKMGTYLCFEFEWLPFGRMMNRPTPAVTDKHMLSVNFTWLGTNIFQLQLELYSSALREVSQIPFFIYFLYVNWQMD